MLGGQVRCYSIDILIFYPQVSSEFVAGIVATCFIPNCLALNCVITIRCKFLSRLMFFLGASLRRDSLCELTAPAQKREKETCFTKWV